MITKAYKFKMKPGTSQRTRFSQFFGSARFIYNWALDLKIKAYKNDKTSLSYVDLAKKVTLLKKNEDYKWLNETPSVCLQQSLRCIDTAYSNFFRNKKGFPKFKSKHHHNDAIKFPQGVQFDFNEWKVKIPKIGWVNICKNREIPSEATIKTLTVKRDVCGTYWCTVITHINKELPPKAKLEKSKSVGIDMGIKYYAILSDGTKYVNPKYFEKDIFRLKKLQRKYSKRKKGSKRKERARLAIAKLHRRINFKRNDFIHKLTSDLVKKDFTTFVMENLNIQGMMKNHCLSRSIGSASWGEFLRQMQYKCEWNGKNLFFIGRFEPSSKTCSVCGYKNDELKLSDRSWKCPNCNSVLDRDINAAINIRNMGLKRYKRHPEGTGGEDAETQESLVVKRQYFV